MRVRWSARSDVGLRREVNQDSYGAEETSFGCLLVVCDGMGGHAAGEVASQLGVEAIVQEVGAHPLADPDQTLRLAFAVANQRIYTEGHGTMGTTGVAALLHHNTLHVANVGDSRAYLIRDGHISQISRDHSLVSDQVAAGLLTPAQARISNVRNIITRALGHQFEVEVDLFQLPLQAGDTILLSSDGMHGLIDDQEIAEIASILPPDEATQRLINRANECGGVDNITVVVAQVDELSAQEALEPLRAEAVEDAAPTEELKTLDLPPVSSTPAAAAPVAAPLSPERPLSRQGLLLAGLLLSFLVAVGGFALLFDPTAEPLPTATTLPARPPEPTATLPTLTP